MKFPLANYLLIFANLVIFLWIKFLASYPETIYTQFGLIPTVFTQNLISHPLYLFTYLPFFSSLFLHAGWVHLIFNLIYLFAFGSEIEKKMGPIKYFLFYLTCGFFATFGQFIFSFHAHAVIIGSSGAISGILAGYLFLYPLFDKDSSFKFHLIHFPAAIFVFFWFCFQAINAFFAFFNGTGSVAWMSHISGFLAGMVFYSFFISKRKDKKIHYI